jgi:hypothetical protein
MSFSIERSDSFVIMEPGQVRAFFLLQKFRAPVAPSTESPISKTSEVTVVVTERQLEGSAIVGWVSRLDASGYFIFFGVLGPSSSTFCGVYATSASRQGLPAGKLFRAVPELSIFCRGYGDIMVPPKSCASLERSPRSSSNFISASLSGLQNAFECFG